MTRGVRLVVATVAAAGAVAYFVAMLVDILNHSWLGALISWGMAAFLFMAAWILAIPPTPDEVS